MSSEPASHLEGDYRLKEVIAENERSRTWLAEQVSISRPVLVEELRPECLDQKEAFLADVRVKAAVDHPLIGSVYEAVVADGRCFYAYELLPGTSLEQRAKEGEPLTPVRLAEWLHRVAEAQLHHESAGRATLPLELRHIHLDQHGVVRLENLAVAGERTPDQSVRDIMHLGEALRPMVADSRPGTTRVLTLLAWMRGEHLEAPLQWRQVAEISAQIGQQLANPSSAPGTRAINRSSRFPILRTSLAAAVIFTLVVAAMAMRQRQRKPVPSPRVALPESVRIPGGNHPTPDGISEPLEEFRISTHEVTIGEYAAFLETLETLSSNSLERTFDHREQPASKTSHEPLDWAAMYAAAKSGGTWNQRPVGLESPVVGVDWWDAAAYAEWKKARLPSQEEWFAALRFKVENPTAIPPGDWCPVTVETRDRTPAGLLGMAGSVCEWTLRQATNPANPLGDRQWVVIGGSFLKPGSNALTREWMADRSLRRGDLGFRLVFAAN